MKTKLKHILNPIHMYCRLREMGFRKKASIKIASFYETKLHKKLFERKKDGQRNTRTITKEGTRV